MTVALLNRALASPEGFSVEDLFDLSTPGDGFHYEIFEGRLVESPPPAAPHVIVTSLLHTLLAKRMPSGFLIAEVAGVFASKHDYYIPDLVVMGNEVISEKGWGFSPSQVHLAVEVVSPGSASADTLMKRDAYARYGIPSYWIVDPRDRTIRILELGDDESYVDKELLRPGQSWTAHHPFEFTFDPAEVFKS